MKTADQCDSYQMGVDFYGGQEIFKLFYQWSSSIPVVDYGCDTYEIEQYVALAIQKVLSGASIKEALYDVEQNYNVK